MDILKDQGQEEISEFSWNKKFFAEFESIIKAEPSVASLDSGDDSENFDEEELEDKIQSDFFENPCFYAVDQKSNSDVFLVGSKI